jgi:hypothetical protein
MRRYLFLFIIPLILACGVSAMPVTSTNTPQSVTVATQTPQDESLPPTPITGHYVTVTAERLYIRPCPSVECYPTGYVLRGAEVRWFARTWNGWLRIGEHEYIYEGFTR